MADITLDQTYNFSTVVEWLGRVNYYNMKLVSRGTYQHLTNVPRLVVSLEGIRSILPESLQDTDFRDTEYYTFREESYTGSTTTGTVSQLVVVPVVLITGDGLIEVNSTSQPKILISPVNRAEYNLVTGAMRDLGVPFEIRSS